MTISEIIKKYLVDNDYDGLAGDDCGCGINDLFLCECCNWKCVPAYRIKSDCDECGNDCSQWEEEYCYMSEIPAWGKRVKEDKK